MFIGMDRFSNYRTILLLFFLLVIGTANAQVFNIGESKWVCWTTPFGASSISAITKDPAGNTYIGGNFNNVALWSGHGVQLDNMTGVHDPAFAKVDGGQINAVVAIPSGGWFIGGTFNSVYGVTRNRLARINADGSLHAFNPNIGGTASVTALALDGSGNLYVGGNFTTVSGTARNKLCQFDNTGALTGFNPNIGGNATIYVNSLALDGSGNLYAGGGFTSAGGIARSRLCQFDNTGALTAFNPNMSSTVSALALDGSGNLYAGGAFTTVGGIARNRLCKLDNTGALTTFDPNMGSDVYALAVDGSGNLYAGGFFTTAGGIARNRLCKFDASGNLTTWDPNMNNWVNALALDGSGNLYAGGRFSLLGGNTSRNYLCKFDASGNLTTWDPNMNYEVKALALNSSGKLYAGGLFTAIGSGTPRQNICKIDASGNLTSWNPGLGGPVNVLKADGSGNVYVGGSFGGKLIRYDITGAETFNGNIGGSYWVNSIALDGSGNVYAGGKFGTAGPSNTIRNHLCQFDNTGALTAWNPNMGDDVNALALDGSGNLYVGGKFTTAGGIARNKLCQFDASGTLTSFNPNIGAASRIVLSLILDGSGNLYAGGNFTTVGGTSRSGLCQFDNTGVLTSFNPSISGTVSALALDGSGNLYGGGQLTAVGGIARNSFFKLDNTGALTTFEGGVGILNGGVSFYVDNSNLYVGGSGVWGGAFNVYSLQAPCTPPSITACPTAPVTANTATGMCTAAVNYTVTASGTPTPTVTYVLTGATTGSGSGTGDGSTFNKGNTTVTVTTTNACGAPTCVFTVTVTDNEIPVLTAPADQSLNVIAGTCAANYTIADPIADNCTGSTWTYTLSGATTFGPSAAIADGTGSGAVSFNKGVTTVTLNGVDAATNAAVQKTFTVTVTDNEAPGISCPANITANNDAGFCSAVVNYTAPVGTDNCAGQTTAQIGGLASGAAFPVGATSNTFEVTAANGQAVHCSFTVTVTDNEAPGISCPANITANNDAGFCSAVVNYTAPVGTDNCAGQTTARTAGLASGAAFPVGNTTNTFVVTAANSQTASCSFTVTVTDNIAPTITCPANATVSSNASCAGAVGTYSAVSATDNCGTPTVSQSNSGDGNLSGHNDAETVTLTATDGNGNSANCSFTVTLKDVTAPSITCPANQTINTGPGVCTAAVTVSAPTVSDNCSISNPVLNFSNNAGYLKAPLNGSVLPLNQLTVEFWAYDDALSSAGGFAGNLFNWETQPSANTPFVFFGDFGNRIRVWVNGAYRLDIFHTAGQWHHYALTFSSNTWRVYYDGNLAGTYTGGNANKHRALDIYVDGNSFGNWNGKTDEIRVWDTARSISDIQTNMSSNVSPAAPGLIGYWPLNDGTGSSTADDLSPSGNDATLISMNPSNDWNFFRLVGVPTVINNFTNTANASGNYPGGTTNVVWTATDAAGNTSTCQQTVTVTDNQMPTIACPANITANTDAGFCSAVVNYATPAGADNCAGQTTAQTTGLASGAAFPVGNTTNTFVVTAANGQTATCSFTVAVTDNEAPTIACPANTTVSANASCAGVVGTHSAVSATDNCGTPTVSQSNSGDGNLSGHNDSETVTLTANDGNGNSANCSFTVTLSDATAPIITCPANITVNNTTGQCQAAVTVPAPVANDNCSGAGLGNALDFDGTNDFVNIGTPNFMNQISALTIESWVYLDAAGNASIFARSGGGNNDIHFNLASNGSVTGLLWTGADRKGTTAPGVITTGTWIHVAMVFNGSGATNADRLKIYANGVAQPLTYTGTISNLTPNCVGENASLGAFRGTELFLNGKLDETRIWTVAKTQAQIVADMNNQLVGNETGLGAYYKYNQGVAAGNNAGITTATATTGANGTLANFALNGTNSNWVNGASGAGGMTVVNNFTNTANASGTYPIGATNVLWTATDAAGNTSTCLQTVTVSDNEVPTITCPANVTVNNTPGLCTGTATLSSPNVSDNCISTTSVTNNTPSTYPIGNTTVTWTITDGAGNASSCQQTVTVEDNEAPTVACPSNIIVNISTGGSPDAVLVAERGGNVLSRVNTVTGVRTIIASINKANGIVIENSTDVLVSRYSGTGTTIVRVNKNTGAQTNIASLGSLCQGMSLDGLGNLYIANQQLNRIQKVDLTTGVVTNVATAGVSNPVDVVFENPNTLLISLNALGRVVRYNLTTNALTILSIGHVRPTDIFNEGDGNILVAENGGALSRVNLATGVRTVLVNLGSAPVGPHGITKDAAGNVYVSLYTAGQIKKVSPANVVLATYTTLNPVFIAFEQGTASGCTTNVNYNVTGSGDNCTLSGVALSPASGSSFSTGTSTVTATATDGSGNTATCAFTVTVNCTGTRPEPATEARSIGQFPSEALDLDIAPNPAEKLVALSPKAQGLEESESSGMLSIFDTQGRLVWQQPALTDQTVFLDVSAWSRGMYFVRMETSKRYVTKRLVLIE